MDIDIEDVRRNIHNLDQLEEYIKKERAKYCELAVEWARQKMAELDKEYNKNTEC